MKQIKYVIAFALTITSVPMLFTMIGIWWLESRFGKEAAAFAVGGTAALVVVLFTASIVTLIVYFTMRSSADHIHDVTSSIRGSRQQKAPQIVFDSQLQLSDNPSSIISEQIKRRALLTMNDEDGEDGIWRYDEEEEFVFVD